MSSKFINIGCGSHFVSEEEWVNLDYTSHSGDVIAHDLLFGIPFGNNSFDMVYLSHVLEHFSKMDGEKLVAECFRVLKPGGTIRIVVPDLEKIVRNYIRFLEAGLNNLQDEEVKSNYDWTLLEMYDQTIRNESGGRMSKYLLQDKLQNEDFVFERLGEEAKCIRKRILQNELAPNSGGMSKKIKLKSSIQHLKKQIRSCLLKCFRIDEKALQIGEFRLGGEIHQWMYDRYSLCSLLMNFGAKNIQVRDAFTSFLEKWETYGLDGYNGNVRKPDSLYIEAIK